MDNKPANPRAIWIDLLALYVVALIATLPYATLIAREDGLPSDVERIIANAVAAALGFWAFGSVVAWFNRMKSNRFLIASAVILVTAGLAFSAAYRRM